MEVVGVIFIALNHHISRYQLSCHTRMVRAPDLDGLPLHING
jgi:hypothetical protein